MCVGGMEIASRHVFVGEISHTLEEPNCVESGLNGYPRVSTKEMYRGRPTQRGLKRR
jgi:hypothetical protein